MHNYTEDHFYTGQRKKLIMSLFAKGISDQNVLDAMLAVPRQLFMDVSIRHLAYEDKAQAIAAGQTISQPFTVAFQSQLLELKKGQKVLEIGTGSGYQGAVLAAMGADVYTVERHEELHKKAKEVFRTLGLKVHTHVGDGTLGWPQKAPFDKILVTAASPSIPQTLIDQLKPGGILVIPCGDRDKQKMYSVHKDASGKTSIKDHGDFAFVPLIGKEGFER